jgi:hypothetical protein
MTTPLALARARHQQALADLQATEAELLAAMKAVESGFAGTVEAMADRRWESKLEGPRPYWELAAAFSAYKRARRVEAKTRSATYRASLAPPPPVTPAKRTRKSKVTFAGYMLERLVLGRAAA